MVEAIERVKKKGTDDYAEQYVMLVLMRVDGQLFGLPVESVRDVLKEQKVASIPLAQEEILGSLNLRGRIVTVMDLRKRLRLKPQPEDKKKSQMFVVIEKNDEFYSLVVDSVSEVISIANSNVETSPANLSANWREVASGICQLKSELLVIIDIATLLKIQE